MFRLGSEPVALIRAGKYRHAVSLLRIVAYSHFNSKGDNEEHWAPLSRYLAQSGGTRKNLFVLDFNKPRGRVDPADESIPRTL